jgi:dethiobiotin synthetase
MTHGIFITGTNTGVGKTAVTVALLRWLGRRGVRAAGLKPVASGALPTGASGELRNADALELQQASPIQLTYGTINPYCFAPAIAPHLAAREAARPVELESLIRWYGNATTGLDIALVEGAGGWRVPLHPRGFLGDLPEALGLPILLVVGLTLGCLNHARLTAEAIDTAGRSRRLGWIANAIDPAFERTPENLATLEELLGAPPLAVARYTPTHSALGTARIEFENETRLPRLLDGAEGENSPRIDAH